VDWINHIVLDHFKVWMTEQLLDVSAVAREKAVKRDDTVPLSDQPVTKV
jgi:hypothetical protein